MDTAFLAIGHRPELNWAESPACPCPLSSRLIKLPGQGRGGEGEKDPGKCYNNVFTDLKRENTQVAMRGLPLLPQEGQAGGAPQAPFWGVWKSAPWRQDTLPTP